MSKLNIDQKSVKALFSEKKADFLIPDYQRPYAWGEKECQTLWDDLFLFALATIRPKDIHPKYLLYSLLSNVASIQTTVFMNGTCAANLSAENVANYYITLPSSTEQKEIADYLDAKCAEIDGLIAKKEQLVKELESYKKSLIYEVVTGKREV